jgi:signal transduction histidine kinase
VNRELEVEFANDRALEYVTVGQRLDADADPHLETLARVVSDLFSSRVSVQLKTVLADGRTLTVSGIPPAAEGDAAIIVVADETQRERDERSQREFATNAAHELRTPLAAIVTAIEMLQTGAKDDPIARDEFLALIDREAARLTRLTRALLVLARADRQERATDAPATVRVRALFDDMAAQAAVSSGVQLRIDCPDDLVVVANPDLVEQALANIVANAARHTVSGSVTLRGAVVGPDAVIQVIDTGPGIAAAEQRRIFDRFYRASSGDGGFGLGLSIAREAVRALGGELELDSTPGRGTAVTIRFPIALALEAA